jgi:hypothetical protein
MLITQELAYDGLERRIQRLRLGAVVEEVRQLLRNMRLVLYERPNSNSGAALRKLVFWEFREKVGWLKRTGRGAVWCKSVRVGDTTACLAATIRVSGRSELIVADLHRLCRLVRGGEIDAGVIIVPSDRLASFLKGGPPSLRNTLTVIEYSDTQGIPLLLMAVEHDGAGPPLRETNANNRG